MNYLYVINTIGLICDFFGFILVFIFGITEMVDKNGAIFLTADQIDEEEAKKFKLYRRLSIVGALLIMVGFSLQLFASYKQI